MEWSCSRAGLAGQGLDFRVEQGYLVGNPSWRCVVRPLRASTAAGALLALAVSQARGDLSLPAFQRASGYCTDAERAMRAGNLKRAKEDLGKALRIVPSLPA